MVSCEETALVPENNYSANEIFASTEAFNATKTTLNGNNNVVWSEEDQVIAFTKTNRASKYQIQYIGRAMETKTIMVLKSLTLDIMAIKMNRL